MSKKESSQGVDGDSDFTEQCMKTFDQTIKEFINVKPNIDVINGKLRPELRSTLNKTNNNIQIQKLKKMLMTNVKQIPINNLSLPIEDPYEILGFKTKTAIQETAFRHTSSLEFAGNYAYSGSCGSGKTLAGISFMFNKQCKTLIISSRNSVNDQWKVLLEKIYPDLVIETRVGLFIGGVKVKPSDRYKYDTDIYIYSPQCLLNQMDKEMYPSLIIYDEVHSLMSEKFIQVLLMPYRRVINKTWKELPYMIAFSATYPESNSVKDKNAFDRLSKIFGDIYYESTSITKTPVHIWDYRDNYYDRGNLDSRYIPLDDYDCVDYFYNRIKTEGTIDVNTKFKGLVMTYTINSSVYAALMAHRVWRCGVVLIRSIDQKSLYFPADKTYDWIPDKTVSYDTIKNTFGIQCDYQDVIDDCSIVVGTFHRLKEGFSVQRLTWGICTKFVYSIASRIQLLGRIRRNSNDEELNNHYRIFYVCSVKVPTNLLSPYRMKVKAKPKILYDFDTEQILFDEENYIRLCELEEPASESDELSELLPN